jgi:hypothetical protein
METLKDPYACGFKRFVFSDSSLRKEQKLLSTPLEQELFFKCKKCCQRQKEVKTNLLDWTGLLWDIYKNKKKLDEESEPCLAPSFFEAYSPKPLKGLINSSYEILFQLYMQKGIERQIIALDFQKPFSSIFNQEMKPNEEHVNKVLRLESACIAFPFTLLSLFLYRYFFLKVDSEEIFSEKFIRYKTQLFLQEYLYHFGSFADVSVVIQDSMHLWFSSKGAGNLFQESLTYIIMNLQSFKKIY